MDLTVILFGRNAQHLPRLSVRFLAFRGNFLSRIVFGGLVWSAITNQINSRKRERVD